MKTNNWFFRENTLIDCSSLDAACRQMGKSDHGVVLSFVESSFMAVHKSMNVTCFMYGIAWHTDSPEKLLKPVFFSTASAVDWEHIRGQYLVVIADTKSETVEVYSDIFGTRNLYYQSIEDGRKLILTQVRPSALEAPELSPELDMDKVKSELTDFPNPTPSIHRPTIYKNVSRMAGSCHLRWSRNGFSLRKYREDKNIVNDASLAKIDTEDLNKRLKELIRSSITRTAALSTSLAIDLSGGLDSGTITGVLLSNTEADFHANSLITEDLMPVEARHVSLWGKNQRVILNKIEISQYAPAEFIPRYLRNFYSIPHSGCYQLTQLAKAAADENCKVRVIGYGPDEFFTHPIKQSLKNQLQPKQICKRLLQKLPLPINFLDRTQSVGTVSNHNLFTDELKKLTLDHRRSTMNYRNSFNHYDPEQNNLYKLNFYRFDNLQLLLSDEISVKQGVFCVFPYLDEDILKLSTELKRRLQLSTPEDTKAHFRHLAAQWLPAHLRQSGIQNDNFITWQKSAGSKLYSNPAWGKSELVAHNLLDSKVLNESLKNRSINGRFLARLYSFECLLRDE